jgi:hypothetical protein
MLIDERHLIHWIEHFYGYGSWQAGIWFIAYEEGGGELPEEVAEKLEYFYNVHVASQTELCNLRDLYGQVAYRSDGPKTALYKTDYDYRFGSHAVQSGVWKNLIAFVHGYRHEKLPDLLEYQKKKLALPSSPEALIRLFPLPSPHHHAWHYSWLDLPQSRFLKHRAQYLDYLYPNRIRTILTNIRTHQPEVIVMYGMTNINELKKSVQTVFSSAVFKTVKAVKQEIPQHHAADLDGTKLIITTQIPALRHGRIETGFDWEKFGKMAAANQPISPADL